MPEESYEYQVHRLALKLFQNTLHFPAEMVNHTNLRNKTEHPTRILVQSCFDAARMFYEISEEEWTRHGKQERK